MKEIRTKKESIEEDRLAELELSFSKLLDGVSDEEPEKLTDMYEFSRKKADKDLYIERAYKCALDAKVFEGKDLTNDEYHIICALAIGIFYAVHTELSSPAEKYIRTGETGARLTEDMKLIKKVRNSKAPKVQRGLFEELAYPMDYSEFEEYKKILRCYIAQLPDAEDVLDCFHERTQELLVSKNEEKEKGEEKEKANEKGNTPASARRTPAAKNPAAPAAVDTHNPVEIFSYLNQYIIGQDRTLRRVAMDVSTIRIFRDQGKEFLPLVRLLIGDTGQGKSEIFRVLGKIFPVKVVDFTGISEVGFKGKDMEKAVLEDLAPYSIVLIDEFCKKVRPSLNSEGMNVNFPVLSELNCMLSGGDPRGMNCIWYLAGAFSEIRESKKKKIRRENERIGFGSPALCHEPGGEDVITRRELLDYGLPREMSSRVTIMEMNRLTRDDFRKIVTTSNSGALKTAGRRADLYGIALHVSDTFIDELVEEAYISDMGARGLNAEVDLIITDKLYEAVKNHEKEIELKSIRC
ncbi:MAG: hypothetical protein IIY55_01055 [Blautia sp.]|nr:hypothetical protein [Blautia sp.]